MHFFAAIATTIVRAALANIMTMTVVVDVRNLNNDNNRQSNDRLRSAKDSFPPNRSDAAIFTPQRETVARAAKTHRHCRCNFLRLTVNVVGKEQQNERHGKLKPSQPQ